MHSDRYQRHAHQAVRVFVEGRATALPEVRMGYVQMGHCMRSDGYQQRAPFSSRPFAEMRALIHFEVKAGYGQKVHYSHTDGHQRHEHITPMDGYQRHTRDFVQRRATTLLEVRMGCDQVGH